jgi:hypothetical protein
LQDLAFFFVEIDERLESKTGSEVDLQHPFHAIAEYLLARAYLLCRSHAISNFIRKKDSDSVRHFPAY